MLTPVSRGEPPFVVQNPLTFVQAAGATQVRWGHEIVRETEESREGRERGGGGIEWKEGE